MERRPTIPPDHPADLEKSLRDALRGEVYFDEVSRSLYATDASLYQMVPQCVVIPRDETDIRSTLQIARSYSLPITVRGAGTSLSGQTFGPGIVLDVSKYMDRILEVNVSERWARVQPGVVRDRLNDVLVADGLHFAPDPATSSRATIGGMIGNNACGTRSVVYGKTIDHVLSCRVILADGECCEFNSLSPSDWILHANDPSTSQREGTLYRGIAELINQHHDSILQRYPKVLRRVSGYNLDEFVDGAGYTGPIGPRSKCNQGQRPWNLTNLIVGSEGTLAIVLDAKIRLTPLPKATALCIVHFDDLIEALRHVDAMLVHQPTAIELLDETVMQEARVNLATRHMADFIRDDTQAMQLVEFHGENSEQAAENANGFASAMRSAKIGKACLVITEPSRISEVWETRKLGLGLISNVKGSTKGRDFIEDACVPTLHLSDYVERIRDLCIANGIQRTSFYAHASVGVVHIVPALDLHDPDQTEIMRTVAQQAFQWVMELGGSWSGEHGDGQLRGEFLPNMFGAELYAAFQDIKRLFDPEGLLNPGKIINTQSMTENLRYLQDGYLEQCQKVTLAAHYKYHDQGGLPLAIEQCNGVGECRKLGRGTMCPSYRVTRNEQDSTRGRANALRMAMSGQLGNDPIAALGSDGIHDCLSLCLACKACKSECPNSVDLAKLKSETLQIRHDLNGVPWGAAILGRLPDIAKRFSGHHTRWAQRIAKLPLWRRFLEKGTGIDHRRPLPSLTNAPLQKRIAQRLPKTLEQNRGKVVLFDDTYANYFEPQLAMTAIDLLENLGYEVIVAQAGCCQRTRLSQGLVREAKNLGTTTLQNLDRFAKQGLPILCLEPSCASALSDDLPDLVNDTAMGQRVANQIRMIDSFLDEQDANLVSDYSEILLHSHCHQKALFGTEAIHRLFKKMPGTTCIEIDSGCCGMAGSFGYEHFELSKKIGEDRLFPAVRKGIQQNKTIVACGISCRHQLQDFLGIQAKHWIQVVRPVQLS